MAASEPPAGDGSGPTPARALHVVRDAAIGSALLHPVRLQMLQHLQQPRTTGELGEAFGISRQKVGYHVRELLGSGLIEEVELPGDTDDDHHVEKRYLAIARHFSIDPAVLGPLAPHAVTGVDPASAERLLAWTASAQTELSALLRDSERNGQRPPSSISLAVETGLTTPVARTGFVQSVVSSVRDAAKEHGVEDGDEPGREYRVFVF